MWCDLTLARLRDLFADITTSDGDARLTPYAADERAAAVSFLNAKAGL
jgi:hypothetical protein